MDHVALPAVHPASLTPAQARALFRECPDSIATTAGFCAGYAQANLIALDKRYAFDFLLFAQRNPKPCPILGVLEPGEINSDLLAGGDIRTDIPAYRIYRDGVFVEETCDATAYWSDDTVAFLIGCSFTFEQALVDNAVPVAHIEQHRNVPMFVTTIDCVPAGVFAGKTVVSMRPIPAAKVADAVRITSRYPAVHGAPIHVGDPAAIGIADLDAPDFGQAVDIPAGSVPVFWACGVTPQAIVMHSKPDLAICHAPGKMLITDRRDCFYQVP